MDYQMHIINSVSKKLSDDEDNCISGMMYRKYASIEEVQEIFPIYAQKLPYGYFDKKGRFISVRNRQRKFEKLIKSVSGVNPELLGSSENVNC